MKLRAGNNLISYFLLSIVNLFRTTRIIKTSCLSQFVYSVLCDQNKVDSLSLLLHSLLHYLKRKSIGFPKNFQTESEKFTNNSGWIQLVRGFKCEQLCRVDG